MNNQTLLRVIAQKVLKQDKLGIVTKLLNILIVLSFCAYAMCVY